MLSKDYRLFCSLQILNDLPLYKSYFSSKSSKNPTRTFLFDRTRTEYRWLFAAGYVQPSLLIAFWLKPADFKDFVTAFQQ